MNYQWTPAAPASKETIDALQNQLNISPVLCQLLAQRGIDNFDKAKSFFRPSLAALHDPYLMKDMRQAVNRILSAVAHGEKIMVYGDYDVDGTTAVSLLYSFLNKHYHNLITYIPDRYKEGYGVSLAGIDRAESENAKLIIALDCGIKAIKQVQYAAEKGIDFIICDHHTPGSALPKATAILNPKQQNCNYPYKELSGCGVGFKLAQALCAEWSLDDREWKVLLDLLVVSIGADIVPMTGENRVLAHFGLQLINYKPRLGLRHLIDIAGKKNQVLNITDVVFLLGPRINAAGRISHGKLAVKLLSSTNTEEVMRCCETINEHNNQRKELDSSITQSALKMIDEAGEQNKKSTVVYDKSWHKGVIGIVASRLIENHYRPTIVFTESNGVLAGSARSVKDFNIYEALEKCEDILEQFGGHFYAAGMTLKPERFEAFKERFEAVVSERILPEQLIPKVEIDAALKFEDIKPSFHKILKQFAPFGPQNLAPVFVTHNLADSGSKAVGGDKTHLRVVFKDPDTNMVMSGIGFGMAHKLKTIQKHSKISIAYHLEENEFNGTTSLQMRVLNIKPTAEALQDLTGKVPAEAN